jgi:hypothetical protein
VKDSVFPETVKSPESGPPEIEWEIGLADLFTEASMGQEPREFSVNLNSVKDATVSSNGVEPPPPPPQAARKRTAASEALFSKYFIDSSKNLDSPKGKRNWLSQEYIKKRDAQM